MIFYNTESFVNLGISNINVIITGENLFVKVIQIGKASKPGCSEMIIENIIAGISSGINSVQ